MSSTLSTSKLLSNRKRTRLITHLQTSNISSWICVQCQVGALSSLGRPRKINRPRYHNGRLSKNLLKEFLLENDYKDPTREQKKLLLEKFNGAVSVKELMLHIRKLQDPPKPLTDGKKYKLLHWMKQNHFRKPTAEERKFLAEEIGLSRSQVNTQIKRILDPNGIMTRKKKDFLKRWYLEELSNHPIESPQSGDDSTLSATATLQSHVSSSQKITPSTEQINQLAKRLKLSRRQIYYQLNRIRSPSRVLSPQEMEAIKRWTQKLVLQKGHTRFSSEEKRSFLRDHFLSNPIPLYQLSHYIERYAPLALTNKNTIEEPSAGVVSDWIDKEKRLPTRQEKINLQQQSHLNRKQMDHRIRSTVDRKGVITAKTKQIVSQWLQQHGRAPEADERLHLQHNTGLSRKQLSDLIYNLLHPQGEITDESKEIVWRFLKEKNGEQPSAAQLQELLKLTGWNRRQLNQQIRHMKKLMLV